MSFNIYICSLSWNFCRSHLNVWGATGKIKSFDFVEGVLQHKRTQLTGLGCQTAAYDLHYVILTMSWQIRCWQIVLQWKHKLYRILCKADNIRRHPPVSKDLHFFIAYHIFSNICADAASHLGSVFFFPSASCKAPVKTEPSTTCVCQGMQGEPRLLCSRGQNVS